MMSNFPKQVRNQLRQLDGYQTRPLLRVLDDMLAKASVVEFGDEILEASRLINERALHTVERHVHYIDPALLPAFIDIPNPPNEGWDRKGYLVFEAERFPEHVFLFVALQRTGCDDVEFIPSLIDIDLRSILEHGQIAHKYSQSYEDVVARLMRLCEVVTPDDLIHELGATTLVPGAQESLESLILKAKRAAALEFLPAITAVLMASAQNMDLPNEKAVAHRLAWRPWQRSGFGTQRQRLVFSVPS